MLFVLATLVSGRAALPQAQITDIHLTALGALLTLVCVAGSILRPTRRIARMVSDSLVVIVLHVLGIAGLLAIASAG